SLVAALAAGRSELDKSVRFQPCGQLVALCSPCHAMLARSGVAHMPSRPGFRAVGDAVDVGHWSVSCSAGEAGCQPRAILPSHFTHLVQVTLSVSIPSIGLNRLLPLFRAPQA